MNWFLLFAQLGGNLIQLEGPYTHADCRRHEYFSSRWCLAGCVQRDQLPEAVAELTREKPSINTAGAYCSDHQIGD